MAMGYNPHGEFVKTWYSEPTRERLKRIEIRS